MHERDHKKILKEAMKKSWKERNYQTREHKRRAARVVLALPGVRSQKLDPPPKYVQDHFSFSTFFLFEGYIIGVEVSRK